jgi:hypothetical protein
MAPYPLDHGHQEPPLFAHPQDDFYTEGSCRICVQMFVGSFCSQSDFGGASVGRRKPVSHVQTSDRGEESTETLIHLGVPATVGGALSS